MNDKKLQKKLKDLLFLRGLARGANVFGFLASAGGNVLHARKTPTGIVIALLAPILVMLGFELVTRIPLREEASKWSKGLRIMATIAIAGIMAVNSYFHQRDAFESETGDHLLAITLPIAIDGLMVIGGVSLIELGVQIRDLEAVIEAGETQVAKSKLKDMAPPKDKPLSKKEQIAQIVARSPELNVQAIADKTGSSYNYAFEVVKALRARAQSQVDSERELEPAMA